MSEELENTENLRAAQAVQQMEVAISEGFQSADVSENRKATNAFGRQVIFSNSTDLNFLSGLASTGLRAGAFICGKNLVANYNQLSAAARQHLATVIHYQGGHNNFHTVAEAGCFQMFASNPQEAADFTMIAHRIAELSLIPGICAHEEGEAKISLPSKEVIINYLGNPDDHIDCPTPAQQIVFGGKRRRVPNWFSLDYPTANNQQKDNRAAAFETAANHQYFYAHLPELIQQAFDEYNSISGTKYAPVISHQTSNAQHLVLTQGVAFHKVCEVVNSLRSEGQKVGCLNLTLLRPFPAEQLLSLLQGKLSVTVLENTNNRHPANGPVYTELLTTLQGSSVSVKAYSGQYGSELSDADIKAVFDNMAKSGVQKFYLGLDFTHETSKFPKHEVLLGNIRREYPDIQEKTLKTTQGESPLPVKDEEPELPNAIRRYKDHGPAYTKLARFFDDTGYFYKTGNETELVADPFQAIPVVPSATANFADLASQRQVIPQFNPQNCTGCGDCFVNCPHSAIPPIVIGLENLIKAGADIAMKKGVSVAKITPQVKNLAKFSAQAITEAKDTSKAGNFLQAGFDELVKRTGLEGEKLNNIKTDFDAILECISELPVAITDPFFNRPNAQEKGAGEIFSLAIDTHACTGCGVCAAACESEALEMVEQTPEIVNEMQSTFQLWEQLPDTSGDTINRMHHDEEYDSFAAILLSRNYYMTMTGGNQSEEGTPSKALLHLITAATESAIQPTIIAQIREIDELSTSLNENIHNKLAEIMPKENFDSLEKAMKGFQGEMTPFDEVIEKMGKKELMKQLDTHAVQRKIDLTRALKDLKWILSEGPTGVGRARYGMTISGAGRWAGKYPYNNFTAATAILWDGSAPELAMGLFQGQLRQLLDNIKIMRRAKLEAKDKYIPQEHDLEIAGLTWDKLTEEEKSLVPPILLVGDKSAMSEQSWAGLSQLLSGDWPIKVIIVDNALVNPDTNPAKAAAQNTTTLLSAIALKNAFVLQGSMGNPSHLFNGILEGMNSPKPALFSVFAPDHEKHFVTGDAWPKLAQLALNSRAFPALRFSPNDGNSYLSSAIHLDSNPSANEKWHTETITYKEGEEEETIEYTLTWADWAHTLKDWKSHFKDYNEEDGVALPVADYISLDEDSRSGKVPVIIRAKSGELQRYAVSTEVVTASEAILAAWNTWRELAGTLIEFPEKLHKHVTAELSAKFASDLAQAKADFDVRLKDQEKAQIETIRQKLKEKLVALSKQESLN